MTGARGGNRPLACVVKVSPRFRLGNVWLGGVPVLFYWNASFRDGRWRCHRLECFDRGEGHSAADEGFYRRCRNPRTAAERADCDALFRFYARGGTPLVRRQRFTANDKGRAA